MSPPKVFDPVSRAAPWWLQAVYFLGVPSAIALLLVWFLRTDVLAGQAKTQATLDQHIKDMYTQQQLIERQLEIQLAQCRIMANGNLERERWCGVVGR